jgi:general secretion pathway protein L
MTLRIHVTHWQDAATPVAWALVSDEKGKENVMRESGQGPLSSLQGLGQSHDAVLILAAPRVLCAPVMLPALRRSKLETALPFALEDQLIEDAAAMHVVPGAKLPDGRTVLYAVERDWLKRILAAAQAAGLRVRQVLPEYALLPVQGLESEWSLAWNGSTGFLAEPQFIGTALDSGDAERMPLTLQLRLAPQALGHEAKALRLYALGNGVPPPAWKTPIPMPLERSPFDWRRASIPPHAPNLLWGRLKAPPRIREFWPWLRPALMALALLFAVEAVFSNLEWALAAREAGRLKAEMVATFREAFGAQSLVVNAPLQMQRKVADLRHAAGLADDGDFSPLLERYATVAQSDWNLKSLRYADGKLDMELTLPAAQARALPQRLNEAGLSAQVVDNRPDNGGRDATLRLRIGAGGR